MNNKKNIVWVILLIIILLIIFGFYYFKIYKKDTNDNLSKEIKVDDVKSSISNEVEKTNPFKADVNPYSGYKNPFVE